MCIRDRDNAAAPKSKAPAQKPEKAVKKEPEKRTAPTIQAAPAPKGPEKPKDAPRRGKEQIVYIKPVSYTHLDVYKRQGLNRSTRTGMFMWPRSPETMVAPSMVLQPNR